MPHTEQPTLAGKIRDVAQPLTGARSDYDALMDLIGDARFVLIGEATHGTHEFYAERARITRRLIEEKGFSAVAVEADWPDAYRVNRYVKGVGRDADSADALGDFQRFPTWMWRNADVLNFIGWLRTYNETRAPDERVGFYGLDLYSLHTSIAAVLKYLDRVDPQAAARARYRYSCFDHFGESPQGYGYAANFGLTPTCENEAVEQLVALQRHALDYIGHDERMAADEYFYAEQNAKVVKNAETYYRSMFSSRISSWNVRDSHMVDVLGQLSAHLQKQTRNPKVVVWAHNSHVGDARTTEMGKNGKVNIGQLVREKYEDAVLVGFTTYAGTVTAASDWDAPAELKRVRPALAGSYEVLFHGVGVPRFLLTLKDKKSELQELRESRLERAIGVIYLPESERISHYFFATLPDQFDAVIHFDETRAVEPLERVAVQEEEREAAETFPSGV